MDLVRFETRRRASVIWLALAVFAGVSLVQSAETRWRLLASLLRRAGALDETSGARAL